MFFGRRRQASSDETVASHPLPLRRILALAAPEWRVLSFGAFFLMLGSVAGLAYPEALRVVIDKAVSDKNLGQVDNVAIVMGVLFFVQALAYGLRAYLFSLAGQRIVARLRERVYASIMGQEIAFFDERNTGELVSRLSSDTAVIQGTVTLNLTIMLRNAVLIVGGIGLLLYHSVALTLVMLSLVPPTALLAVWMGRRIQRVSRDVQDALAEAASVAQESISGIRTVRAFARENQSVDRYGKAVWTAFRSARRRAKYNAVFVSISVFAAYGAISAVIWYGGRLVVEGKTTVGTLAMFVVYTLMVAIAMAAFGELYADLMGARGAAERVFSLLDRTSKMTGGGERLASVQGAISFEGVDFRYPARPDLPVLHGIDLQARPGEIVALVGPSGSGKSTIASLIPRFYDPDAGCVRIDGHDVRDLDANALREVIGVVAQEPILFSASIGENVLYGRQEATEEEVVAALGAANALDFVDDFPDGIETAVGEHGRQLSAGQKQRIAIARAVLKDPRILILDEATSALDSESEHLVQEALDRLMVGRTTLVIAHRLSTVRHADRVLVIEQGRIVQSGSHEALMEDSAGLYHRLVRKQFSRT